MTPMDEVTVTQSERVQVTFAPASTFLTLGCEGTAGGNRFTTFTQNGNVLTVSLDAQLRPVAAA